MVIFYKLYRSIIYPCYVVMLFLYYSDTQHVREKYNCKYCTFYPSFRMYFNLLTLVVCMILIMKPAPVFPYRNLGIRCFQLKQNGVATWNVQMKNLSNVQELEYCKLRCYFATCFLYHNVKPHVFILSEGSAQ